MIYLAWAGFYEGGGDRSYYDVLLPRIMEEITLMDAIQQVTIATTPVLELGRKGRRVKKVAEEVCSNRSQIHILFIHADTGGRSLVKTLPEGHPLTARQSTRSAVGMQIAALFFRRATRPKHGFLRTRVPLLPRSTIPAHQPASGCHSRVPRRKRCPIQKLCLPSRQTASLAGDDDREARSSSPRSHRPKA